MKSCERFTERLSDYAEKSLASETKNELEAHFKECSECRSTANGIIILRRTLHDLPTLHTSPDFETILRTRIKLGRRLNSVPAWNLRQSGYMRVATYSAAVLVLISIFYLWQRQTERPLSSSPSAIAVSPIQLAPDKTHSPVTSAKFLYTLDKVTPQLWPNFGATRRGSGQTSPSPPTDSLRASPKTPIETTPASHQAITF